MEDALAPSPEASMNDFMRVLILVVMEDALAQHRTTAAINLKRCVLILVVMEDALALII